MIKNAACALLWVALSLGALWYVNRVLVVKNREGITTMQNYYLQEKDTVDVLVLGSSHAGMNVDTSTLWSEYGIASYVLWGAAQPFWNSYHFLVEALKTQTPKAVALEVYAASFTDGYQYDEGQVVNTAGMRLSLNKWEAVKVSAPRERWLDLFFGLPLYHERYSELTQEDYSHFPWSEDLINQKGSLLNHGSKGSVELADVSGIRQIAEPLEKENEYLRRIISLCQEKDIPILLFKTPEGKQGQLAEQPYYNWVAQIAEEYGIPFCNMNLIWEEMGLSGDDFPANDGHLNNKGAAKVSMHLGQELQALCDIPDRRGDVRFASWDADARRIQFPSLSGFSDTTLYLEELKRRDFAVFVATNRRTDAAEELLAVLEIPQFPSNGDAAWLLTSTQDGKWIEASKDDKLFAVSADGLDVVARIDGWTWLMVNEYEVIHMQECDILIGVFDLEQGRCVDAVRLRANSPGTLQHLM